MATAYKLPEPPTDLPRSTAPTRISIYVAGKDLPEWVIERMTTGEIGGDFRFQIEANTGTVTVEPGFAIFEIDGSVFACPPRQVQDTIKAARGEPVEAPAPKAPPRTTPKAASSDGKVLKLKAPIGTPPSPQFVAVSALRVDDTYQRSIEGGASKRLITKIAENWDWRLCLPLLVSRRGGELFVIDGQHRKEAAELRGDIPHLPVVVFDFDDPRAEAELFVAANRSRRSMSQLDDFHAAVVAGDKKAVAVNDVVTAAGLSVGRVQAWQYWKPGEVVFVKAIQNALHTSGRQVVELALGMIARAFEGLVLTGVGAVFTGLCTIIQDREKAGTPLDVGLMEVVLAEVGIPGWKEATEGSESGLDRAEAMLKALAAAYAEAEAQ